MLARRVLKRFLAAATAEDDQPFWGSAGAGCIPLALDTGRFCMQHRSGFVNEPGTWGTWGGAIDPGETTLDAVRRELVEEAGYRGAVAFKKLHVFKKADFTYTNYLARVPHEFDPRHSWESQGHLWVTLEDLPTPLHFGFKAVLAALAHALEV
jgi:8-oxo-dGTP pyrophosphatase MutT (NUDIX family)